MIADITPQPNPMFFWQAFLAIAFLAGIGANVATMMSVKRSLKREITPQPLVVKEAANYVRKEDCVQRHAESTQRFEMLKEQLDELRIERHTDTNALHEKVNAVALQVSGLDVATQQQNAWLKRMDEKLDQINRRPR